MWWPIPACVFQFGVTVLAQFLTDSTWVLAIYLLSCSCWLNLSLAVYSSIDLWRFYSEVEDLKLISCDLFQIKNLYFYILLDPTLVLVLSSAHIQDRHHLRFAYTSSWIYSPPSSPLQATCPPYISHSPGCQSESIACQFMRSHRLVSIVVYLYIYNVQFSVLEQQHLNNSAKFKNLSQLVLETYKFDKGSEIL